MLGENANSEISLERFSRLSFWDKYLITKQLSPTERRSLKQLIEINPKLASSHIDNFDNLHKDLDRYSPELKDYLLNILKTDRTVATDFIRPPVLNSIQKTLGRMAADAEEQP